MKPIPRRDFPISVRRQSWEEEPKYNHLYEGIFEIRLNFTVDVSFVPASRSRIWPPRLPKNTDDIQSSDEARIGTVALSKYSVVPDNDLKGTEKKFDREWSESGDGTVFYVSEDEFHIMSSELALLADQRPSVHSKWEIDEVKNLRIVHFLLNRLLSSNNISKEDLAMLRRP